jgi:hypothetical protein
MTRRRVDDIFEIVDLLSGEILKMVLPRSQVVFYLELLLINIFPLSLKPANFLPLVITPVSVEDVEFSYLIKYFFLYLKLGLQDLLELLLIHGIDVFQIVEIRHRINLENVTLFWLLPALFGLVGFILRRWADALFEQKPFG